MPEPDGKIGRSPWWYRRTIERWLATRPQRGERGSRKLAGKKASGNK
jgi:hypothetical protein